MRRWGSEGRKKKERGKKIIISPFYSKLSMQSERQMEHKSLYKKGGGVDCAWVGLDPDNYV